MNALRWVKTEVPVRYVECDPMGVVHHSHYLNWLEIGRTELAKEAGIVFHEFGQKVYLPVVRVDCTYKESARYGDIVIVETALHRPTKAYLQFEYRLYRKNGRALLATGVTEHVLTYPDGRLIYRIPHAFQQQIDHFLAGVV